MKRRIICALCLLLALALPLQAFAEETEITVEETEITMEETESTVEETEIAVEETEITIEETIVTDAALSGNVIVDGLDDSYDDPQYIYNGETLSGTVDTTSNIVDGFGLVSDQNDYFRFVLTTTSKVTIRVSSDVSLYSVVLWGPDGTNLTNGTTISRELAPGTYTVTIQNKPNTGMNAYTISLNYCAHSGKTAVTTPATCTADGSAQYYCSACGMSWKETIPATGHTPGQWTVTSEATCTAVGTKSATCSDCGSTITRDIPMIDHVYSDWTVTKEPTCASGGIRTKVCSGCGETVLEELPANEHSFTELELTKAPSTTREGTLSVVCGSCGEVESTQTLPVVTSTLSYTVPEGVTRIGSSAFYNSEFSSILLPDSVTHIASSAFRYCVRLTSMIIPDSVTTIGQRAFESCDNLTAVRLPDNITAIESYTFYDCRKLTKITIPAGVTRIGNIAFENCQGLTSVEIPASVEQIGSLAFYNCTGLEAVYITDLEAWCGINFDSLNSNPLYNGAKLYVNGKLLTDCVIPDGVTRIYDYAFCNYDYLTSLSIPASVTYIGGSAFYGCDSLSRVTISGNPYTHNSFNGCPALKTLCFTGDAWKSYSLPSFTDVTATAYYPAENDTWTESIRERISGNLTWVACPHDFPGHSCTSNGICRNCGAVKAACHEYTDPTCTNPGSCVYCSAAGEEALGHTETTTKAQAPTCTETGLTEGKHCSVCGEILTAQETVPALGHITNIGGTTCNRCGKTISIPSVPMYRMYDPNSGEHFYTGAEAERDFLMEAGWHYEGVGFNFPEEGEPVYRLYEPVYGEHLYTMDQAEVNKLVGWGWRNEGVAFNSAGTDEVPQYRLHNPNAQRGGYHFTGSVEERDFLISIGWINEGIGWYSCQE